MAANTLSEDLASFIDAAIPSVWALDILILIRSEPVRAWTADVLVRDLRASDRIVADILKSFERVGLVTIEEGEVRYAPPLALDTLCASLQAAYRERPVTVVNAIVQRRTGPLTTFAEAFRLRGNKS